MNGHITLFLMVEYKDARKASIFLAPEDYDENKKTIFVNLDDPNLNIEETFNYLINDWMGFIFNLPVTTPIFFDLVQEGKKHSYKGTPEKISTILKCLQSRNFDEMFQVSELEFIHLILSILMNKEQEAFLTMYTKKIFLSALKIN